MVRRRFLATLPMLLGVAACSPLTQATFSTLGEAVRLPRSEKQPTPEEVKATSFAKLWLEVPGVGSAQMVLGREIGDTRFWATSTRQVIVERHGLVIRSYGFTENLTTTRWLDSDPFVLGLHRLPEGFNATREVDWMPDYRSGIKLQTGYSRPVPTVVNILGAPTPVVYVEERLFTPPSGEYSARNRFWIAQETGQVLRSEQQLTPSLRVGLTLLQSWQRN